MGFFDFLKPKPAGLLRYNLSSEREDQIRRSWQQVDELIKLGKPSQLRQAVIEADKLVDKALRDLVLGSTLGERLKSARDLFPREVYSGLWEAHKIRNSLVHEAGYEPPYYVCREAVGKFKEALLALRVNLVR